MAGGVPATTPGATVVGPKVGPREGTDVERGGTVGTADVVVPEIGPFVGSVRWLVGLV